MRSPSRVTHGLERHLLAAGRQAERVALDAHLAAAHRVALHLAVVGGDEALAGEAEVALEVLLGVGRRRRAGPCPRRPRRCTPCTCRSCGRRSGPGRRAARRSRRATRRAARRSSAVDVQRDGTCACHRVVTARTSPCALTSSLPSSSPSATSLRGAVALLLRRSTSTGRV